MRHEVDLVITFRAAKKTSLSKQQIRQDSRKAQVEYTRLIDTLKVGGLRAVGRRGESLGHLLVFVSCPNSQVASLAKRERHADFLEGLPTTPLASNGISPADRIRLVYAYVTSNPSDGGLGVTPKSPDWDLVESVMTLHDKEFNDAWVRNWSVRHIASVQLEKIRGQFGDSVAFYYDFLASYTKALVFPAVLGLVTYLLDAQYSPTYSFLVFVWAVVFVEWWRVRERILSLRFGTLGSFRVESTRPDHKPGMPWWKRELRILVSLPVLLLFAGVLTALLTGIFVIEAFVTELYTGPGKKYISFSPTILFVALVPRFLALYQSLAARMTTWENHAHHSTHAASLTLKTFALSALVAYLGLGLSAFVYVPFGAGVMQIMQAWIFKETTTGHFKALNTTDSEEKTTTAGFWDMDTSSAIHKLNHGRLKEQMFASMVTNQVVNTLTEVGLPFVFRAISALWNGRKAASAESANTKNGVKKRVVFEDEKEKGGMEEREFLDRVRAQAALPDYELFTDYDEMVTQFGYIALWSTIWPLAPVVSLLNNFLEIRSDAFKMTVHNRRPIPCRTDTIGPWLDALTFLTWLSAMTNPALVHLFCPPTASRCSAKRSLNTSQLDKVHTHLYSAAGSLPADDGAVEGGFEATKELLLTALLIALAASHGYIILRAIVRHIIERLFWTGSAEVMEGEREDREIKEQFLNGFVAKDDELRWVIESGDGDGPGDAADVEKVDEMFSGFWDNDEGLEEISRISKEV